MSVAKCHPWRINTYDSSLLAYVITLQPLAYRTLEILQALLEPSSTYILSSLLKTIKKLTGLAKIWAWVVSGIGLIYCELFFGPRPSSHVGYLPALSVMIIYLFLFSFNAFCSSLFPLLLQFTKQRSWIKEHFPKDTRYETLIISGDNVLLASHIRYVSWFFCLRSLGFGDCPMSL